MNESYKKALADARKELDETQHQIAVLEQKAYDLRQSVATLAKLCGEPSGIEEELGITDAVRTVLKGNGWMTAAEVITGLRDIGFPIDKQVAQDAVIRTILNRLVIAGEAGKRQRETDGRLVYYSLEFPLMKSMGGRMVRIAHEKRGAQDTRYSPGAAPRATVSRRPEKK